MHMYLIGSFVIKSTPILIVSLTRFDMCQSTGNALEITIVTAAYDG